MCWRLLLFVACSPHLLCAEKPLEGLVNYTLARVNSSFDTQPIKKSPSTLRSSRTKGHASDPPQTASSTTKLPLTPLPSDTSVTPSAPTTVTETPWPALPHEAAHPTAYRETTRSTVLVTPWPALPHRASSASPVEAPSHEPRSVATTSHAPSTTTSKSTSTAQPAISAARASTTNAAPETIVEAGAISDGSGVEPIDSEPTTAFPQQTKLVSTDAGTGCVFNKKDDYHLLVDCDAQAWTSSDSATWFRDSFDVESVALNAPYSVPSGGAAWRFAGELQRLTALSFLAISLQHVDLEQSEVQQLLIRIGTLTHLKEAKLDLSSTGLFREADVTLGLSQSLLGVAGLGALGQCSELVSLRLMLVGDDLKPASARDLARGLARLVHLQHLTLDVSMNTIQDVGVWELSSSLGRLTELTSLSLRVRLCSMSAAGLLELSIGLGRLRKLSDLSLDISFNHLGDDSAAELAFSRFVYELSELAAARLKTVRLDITGVSPRFNFDPDSSAGLDFARLANTGLAVTLVEGMAARPLQSQLGRRSTSSSTSMPPQKTFQPTTTLSRRAETTSFRQLHSPPTPDTPHTISLSQTTSRVHPAKAPIEVPVMYTYETFESSTSSAWQQLSTTEAPSTSQQLSRSPSSQSDASHASHNVASTTRASIIEPKHIATVPDTTSPEVNVSGSSNYTNNETAIFGIFAANGGSLDSSFVVIGLMVCIAGSVLVFGGSVCGSRARSGRADRDAGMSMLGSMDQDDAPARGRLPLSAPKRSDQRVLQKNTTTVPEQQELEQQDLEEGNDSEGNFANFESFSDTVPVVQSWKNAAAPCAPRLTMEREDSTASDSLEAMLEAQVAALGDGEIQMERTEGTPETAALQRTPESFATEAWPEVKATEATPSCAPQVPVQKIEAPTKPRSSPELTPKAKAAQGKKITAKLAPPDSTTQPVAVTSKWPVIAPPK